MKRGSNLREFRRRQRESDFPKSSTETDYKENESTRNFVMEDKGVPVIEHTVNTGESTRTMASINKRYYLSPLPEQQGTFQEMEVAGVDVKIQPAEGVYGAVIYSQEVKEGENGRLEFGERKEVLRQYFGREYSVEELDLRIATLQNDEAVKSYLELTAMRKAMKDKGLERVVKVEDGKVIALTDNAKVVEKQ